MSWDILVFNSAKPFNFEEEVCSDFESREQVIANINSSFPNTVWNDDVWGSTSSEVSIEFNLGHDIGNNFMLHIRGGGDPETEVIRMCTDHKWIAFDISGNNFLGGSSQGTSSFDDWQNYKDQVVNRPQEKPWWKFWA